MSSAHSAERPWAAEETQAPHSHPPGDVGDAVDDGGGLLKSIDENGQDVANAGKDLHAVVEGLGNGKVGLAVQHIHTGDKGVCSSRVEAGHLAGPWLVSACNSR